MTSLIYGLRIDTIFSILFSVPTSAPITIKAFLQDSTSIMVVWQPPEEANGEITQYKIYYTSVPSLDRSGKNILSCLVSFTLHDFVGTVIFCTVVSFMFSKSCWCCVFSLATPRADWEFTGGSDSRFNSRCEIQLEYYCH